MRDLLTLLCPETSLHAPVHPVPLAFQRVFRELSENGKKSWTPFTSIASHQILDKKVAFFLLSCSLDSLAIRSGFFTAYN
jgi:hypothetical protein